VTERLHGDVDDLRDERALAHSLGRLADLAQPAVFLVERLEAQQLSAGHAQLLGELRIFGTQAPPVGEAAGDPAPQLIGCLHDRIDWICSGAHPQARRFEIAAAMVQDHHDDGDDAKKEQAGAERRPATYDRAAVGA
jgi:hypothetical protein